MRIRREGGYARGSARGEGILDPGCDCSELQYGRKTCSKLLAAPRLGQEGGRRLAVDFYGWWCAEGMSLCVVCVLCGHPVVGWGMGERANAGYRSGRHWQLLVWA